MAHLEGGTWGVTGKRAEDIRFKETYPHNRLAHRLNFTKNVPLIISFDTKKNSAICQTSYCCCSDKKTDLEKIWGAFKRAAQNRKQINTEPGPTSVLTQSWILLSLIPVVSFLKEAISLCPMISSRCPRCWPSSQRESPLTALLSLQAQWLHPPGPTRVAGHMLRDAARPGAE